MSKKKIQKTRVDGVTQGYHVGSGADLVPTARPAVPARDALKVTKLRTDLEAALNHPALRSDVLGDLIEGGRTAATARRAYTSARLEATEARYNALAAKRGLAPVTDEEKQDILDTAELLYGAGSKATAQEVDNTYGQAVLAVLSGRNGRLPLSGIRGVLARWALGALEPRIATLKADAAYEHERREKARAATEADYQSVRDFNARWRGQ